MTTGTRIPTLGFITGGTGQSNEGIPPHPYETYAYDSALLEAKIENFNVVPYTSVLPPQLLGHIWPVSEVLPYFQHGAVLEVIMANTGASKSDNSAIATGIGMCWAIKNGYFIGGYAAEYVQLFSQPITATEAQQDAINNLTESLDHELDIRGLTKWGNYQFYWNYLNLEKKYGYCLTAIGFLNFDYAPPVPSQPKPEKYVLFDN